MDLLQALDPSSFRRPAWSPGGRASAGGLLRMPGRVSYGGEEYRGTGIGIAGGLLAIKVSEWRGKCSTIVVRAGGPKKKGAGSGGGASPGNNDSSDSEGDFVDASKPVSGQTNSNDSTGNSYNLTDWRDFRADLVAREQALLVDPNISQGQVASHDATRLLDHKWAHPIPMPETGCVLVATEKLDGVHSFERSVVLLLGLGAGDAREGPYGVVINRPFDKRIKQMTLNNSDLATTFGNCPLHYGGPINSFVFLLNTGENRPNPNLGKVVPGIYFGVENSLGGAIDLVKKGLVRLQDFRFFVGHSGWHFDQLMHEIESDYWVVAACSSNLISGGARNSPDLWGEILQLMGGKYLELSRKPKPDTS